MSTNQLQMAQKKWNRGILKFLTDFPKDKLFFNKKASNSQSNFCLVFPFLACKRLDVFFLGVSFDKPLAP